MHQHCQFCMDRELLDADDTCCICVGPRTINLPSTIMSLAEAEKYLKDTLEYEDQKNKKRAEEYLAFNKKRLYWLNFDKHSDLYIEALNGARKMRTELFDKIFDWNHTKRFPFLIRNMFESWWKYAHDYSDPPLPRVYEWGKFHERD